MITLPYFNERLFVKQLDMSWSSGGGTATSRVISMGKVEATSSYAQYSHANNRIEILKGGKYSVEMDLIASINHGHGNSSFSQVMEWRLENNLGTKIALVQTRRIATGNTQLQANSFLSQASVVPTVNSPGTFTSGSPIPSSQAANGITYGARLYFHEEMVLDAGNWLRFWEYRDAGNADNFIGAISGYLIIRKIT